MFIQEKKDTPWYYKKIFIAYGVVLGVGSITWLLSLLGIFERWMSHEVSARVAEFGKTVFYFGLGGYFYGIIVRGGGGNNPIRAESRPASQPKNENGGGEKK